LEKDFFIVESCNENIKTKYFNVSYDLSKYIFVDFFLSVEVSGIRFPCRFFNCKNIMGFHGLGTYNLLDEVSKLSKFDLLLCPNSFYMEALEGKLEGELLPFGYPRLINREELNLSESAPDSFTRYDHLYYIPHWREDGSLFENIDEVKRFSEKFKFKWISPHQYIYKNKESVEKCLKQIQMLLDYGFEISNLSIDEVLDREGVFLIDIFSSSYAEALFLGKEVYFLDCSTLTDPFIRFLKLIGVCHSNYRRGNPLTKRDKGRLCYSCCSNEELLPKTIMQL
jgi:hypothetical protein